MTDTSSLAGQVATPWGLLEFVRQDGALVWKIRCPQCGHWGQLDDDQLHGRVSLDHANCGRDYPLSECDCTWHETHDYTTQPKVAFVLRADLHVEIR